MVHRFLILSRIFLSTFLWFFCTSQAWAIGDGEWFSTVYCTSRLDTRPVRPPMSFILPIVQIKDGKFQLDIRVPDQPNFREVWNGRVESQQVTVNVQGTRGGNDQWAYRFEGPNSSHSAITVLGDLYVDEGKKVRTCSLGMTRNTTDLINIDGIPFVTDYTLMRLNKDKNAYTVRPSAQVLPLNFSQNLQGLPSAIQGQIDVLQKNPYAKLVTLINGPDIIFLGKEIVEPTSLFYSASVGKTVTAAAIGQAICHGHVQISDKISTHLPELKGLPLGAATIRDLLMMAAGVADPQNKQVNGSGNFLTGEDFNAYWRDPNFRFSPILFREKTTSMQKTLFSEYAPGERFSYNNINPMLLGLIINRTTQMTYAQWLQTSIFNPAGFEGGGFVSQDSEGIGSADGVFGLRLKVADWIRFAIWWREAYERDDCFGKYLKEASLTQIRNGPARTQRRTASDFSGYGYLMWTDHEQSKDSFWALGFGGQLIGWNSKNKKSIMAMSNLQNWENKLVNIYSDWIRAAP